MPDRASRKTIPPSFARTIGRTIGSLLVAAALAAAVVGCSSSPQPKFKRFAFPKNVYSGDVQRPYTVLGPVRARVDYPSLDVAHEEKELCRNYYNKAARDLLKYARKQGADAVIDVKSVVFLVDGRTELHQAPECSDDGMAGQVLTQGIAVRWTGAPVGAGAWVSPLARQKAAEAQAAQAEAERVAKSGKAAAALSAEWPKATRPGMPMMPEGGQLVPDLMDDPALSDDESMGSEAASAEASAPAAEAAEKPVTGTLSAPLAAPQGPVSALPPVPAAAPPRRPAAQKSEEASTSAARRLPFADPRAIPRR
jgi:hypothetical protein